MTQTRQSKAGSQPKDTEEVSSDAEVSSKQVEIEVVDAPQGKSAGPMVDVQMVQSMVDHSNGLLMAELKKWTTAQTAGEQDQETNDAEGKGPMSKVEARSSQPITGESTESSSSETPTGTNPPGNDPPSDDDGETNGSRKTKRRKAEEDDGEDTRNTFTQIKTPPNMPYFGDPFKPNNVESIVEFWDVAVNQLLMVSNVGLKYRSMLQHMDLDSSSEMLRRVPLHKVRTEEDFNTTLDDAMFELFDTPAEVKRRAKEKDELGIKPGENVPAFMNRCSRLANGITKNERKCARLAGKPSGQVPDTRETKEFKDKVLGALPSRLQDAVNNVFSAKEITFTFTFDELKKQAIRLDPFGGTRKPKRKLPGDNFSPDKSKKSFREEFKSFKTEFDKLKSKEQPVQDTSFKEELKVLKTEFEKFNKKFKNGKKFNGKANEYNENNCELDSIAEELNRMELSDDDESETEEEEEVHLLKVYPRSPQDKSILRKAWSQGWAKRSNRSKKNVSFKLYRPKDRCEDWKQEDIKTLEELTKEELSVDSPVICRLLPASILDIGPLPSASLVSRSCSPAVWAFLMALMSSSNLAIVPVTL
eukprot:Nk52_evm7s243 gene=Nk52_evmTU7s243